MKLFHLRLLCFVFWVVSPILYTCEKVSSSSTRCLQALETKWKVWCQKMLDGVCSLQAGRQGPKILVQAAYSVVLFIALTSSWYVFRTAGNVFGSGVLRSMNWDAVDSSAATDGKVGGGGGGLRMVVFGGGDVATPGCYAATHKPDDGKQLAWTEVMCQKLGCDTYLSFIPEAEGMSGAVMSNSLLDAAHQLVSPIDSRLLYYDDKPKLDYSWVSAEYPLPSHSDLASQIDNFLSLPKEENESPEPAETLWVFNVGYTDIWNLAALPRRLATQVLDTNLVNLFFQIERLYTASQKPESVAFSDYYSSRQPSSSPTAPQENWRTYSKNNKKMIPREPFRIYITQVFDVTLTPGWETARATPPSPHSHSDHMRNAAFLTAYWNTVLGTAVDDWLATSDPEDWSTADSIDIEVVRALAANEPVRTQQIHKTTTTTTKKEDSKTLIISSSSNGGGVGAEQRVRKIPFPRREAASYSIARYVRELLIDRQLRNSDLSDAKGLGARPSEDGFLYIATPCVSKYSVNMTDPEDGATYADEREEVCGEPDNHLFYTEFTLGQRAIHEIGVRAARRFMDQVEVGSRWRGGWRASTSRPKAKGKEERGKKKAIAFKA